MFLPGYWSKKLEYFSLITKKKVEIFHFILRGNSTKHDEGSSLHQIVKVIASRGFLATFQECFVPFYFKGVSDNSLWLVTGKTAEFLQGLFQRIASNSGKAKKVCFCCKQCKYNFLDDHIKCSVCACM